MLFCNIFEMKELIPAFFKYLFPIHNDKREKQGNKMRDREKSLF